MKSGHLSDPDVYTSVDALRRLQYHARGFTFTPKQPINSILSGKNVSKLRGRGLNFEEMRQYQLGDDIRTMDWKVTMRTGKPHVKVFNEEKERSVFLLVDQRLNMFFGSKGKMKSVIAAEVAALAAWRILDSTDRIGAIVFNDNTVTSHQPKRSNHQVIQILAEIVRQNRMLNNTLKAADHGTSLNAMFEKLLRVVGHDSLVILISDGRGWDDKSTEYVKKLRQHNELIVCHVVDALERFLPAVSQLTLSDGELQLEITNKDRDAWESYQNGIASQLEKLAKISSKFRIPVINFETTTDTARQIQKGLGARHT